MGILLRWVEGPDGLEQVELPLTPELFLNPELDDTMVQARPHSRAVSALAEWIERHLLGDPDALVLSDVQLRLGRGLPKPAPDVAVFRGVPNLAPDSRSYDVEKIGAPPCLIVEVVSPDDARIRRVDEVKKLKLYERVGVPEYLLIDLPRRATGHRHRVRGYRLAPHRRYEPIEPDERGRILSGTTGLLFGASPEGDRLQLFDAATGDRLLTPAEIDEARRAAEEEVARLRAELERLKKNR